MDQGSSEAQHQSHQRPIIAANIARYGEDEKVIMRRKGGWVRTYRRHHKADTMATTGHIINTMRDIDTEQDKNDWVTAVVDVPGVGGGLVDRLVEIGLPVTPYNGGEPPSDKERFVNARAEDFWNLRQAFQNGEIDIDPDDDNFAAHLGLIKWLSTRVVASRSNRKTTWEREVFRHLTGPIPQQCCSRAGHLADRSTWRVMPAEASRET